LESGSKLLVFDPEPCNPDREKYLRKQVLESSGTYPDTENLFPLRFI
jgi:hypothetical protein